MSKIDHEQLLNRTLSYLGASRGEGASVLSGEIEQAIKEVEREAHFRMCYEIYALQKTEDYYQIPEISVTLTSRDINAYFEGCDRVCVILSSLGVETERFLKRQQALSMSHGIVTDACAGAYLELMTDAAEEELNLGPRTYRFCPGYGDLPLELNVALLAAINGSKRVGVTHTGGGLFLPQKSMLGLIGLGKSNLTKSCGSCIRREDCSLRAEGTACYR